MLDLKRRIFVKHHLGMGDTIIHNGMIRKISEDNSDCDIFLAARNDNFKNVQYMFRDNPQIKVLGVTGENQVREIIQVGNFNKVISTHMYDVNLHYGEYFDDSFYKVIGMDPDIKFKYFHLERDLEIENKIYEELIIKKDISDYIFVHEKPENNITINRDLLESDLPVVFADPIYGLFELLKVIECAKSVHIISSCFLSLMCCKKFNQNIVAHMYCDRQHISPYIQKHGIRVLE
jgi:hypothetical protein